MSIISKLIAPTALATVTALAAFNSGTAAAQPLSIDDDPAPPPPASAPDVADRPYVGVGAARALAPVAGLAAIVRLNDSLDLDAILGLARVGGANGADDATHLGLVIGVRTAVARRGVAALWLGGRVGLIARADADRTDLILEAPARLELTATPWLRLHVEGGFALVRTPGQDSPEGPVMDSSTSWALGNAGLAAGAGFTLAL